jgi:hypothetical protein
MYRSDARTEHALNEALTRRSMMDRRTRSERIGIGAMALMALASLFVVAHGYVAAGVLLFVAAATPLPVLAAIRARSSRDGNANQRR